MGLGANSGFVQVSVNSPVTLFVPAVAVGSFNLTCTSFPGALSIGAPVYATGALTFQAVASSNIAILNDVFAPSATISVQSGSISGPVDSWNSKSGTINVGSLNISTSSNPTIGSVDYPIRLKVAAIAIHTSGNVFLQDKVSATIGASTVGSLMFIEKGSATTVNNITASGVAPSGSPGALTILSPIFISTGTLTVTHANEKVVLASPTETFLLGGSGGFTGRITTTNSGSVVFQFQNSSSANTMIFAGSNDPVVPAAYTIQTGSVIIESPFVQFNNNTSTTISSTTTGSTVTLRTPAMYELYRP